MTRQPQTSEGVRKGLEWNDSAELTLNRQAMILMPRHFFLFVMEQVEALAGREVFEKIFRRAGYDGAVLFCRRYEEAMHCTPREAVEGYLEEMSLRGWGRYEIQELDEKSGRLKVLLHHSALKHGRLSGAAHGVWAAAMEGAMAYMLERSGGTPALEGKETRLRPEDPPDAVRIEVVPREETL